jgi:hypothetical protein
MLEETPIEQYGSRFPLKPYLPGILNVALLFAYTLWCTIQILSLNDGHFSYAIDDSFIHMAVSKHLAIHGVFGVTPYAFSSANSSILWPLGLALIFRITGPWIYAPLLINLLLCSGLLIHVNKILNRLLRGIDSPAKSVLIFGFLIGFSALVSLPMFIFIGMEHALQTWVVVAFVDLAILGLMSPDDSHPRLKHLLGLSFLMTAVRWDDGICLAVVALLILWKGQVEKAVLMVAVAAVPVAIFAAISLLFHWFPVPNSIVLKSLITHPFDWSQEPLCIKQIFTKPYLVWLMALAVFGVILKRRNDDKHTAGNYWTIVYVAATLIYFQSSVVPEGYPLYYHRYDSFLVAIGLMAIAHVYVEFAKVLQSEWAEPKLTHYAKLSITASLMIGIVLASGMAWQMCRYRVTSDINTIPQACKNIFEQQQQMGEFVHRYYSGQGVALNDIGAVDYLADIHLTDLAGLGSIDVARARLQSNFNTDTIRSLTKGTKLVIVYESWFQAVPFPSEWTKIGQWQIQGNVICGCDTVSIYVTDARDASAGLYNLHQFGTTMPTDIIQTFNEPKL